MAINNMREIGTISMEAELGVRTCPVFQSDETSDIYVSALGAFDILNLEGEGYIFEDWIVQCGSAADSPSDVLLAALSDTTPSLLSYNFISTKLHDVIPDTEDNTADRFIAVIQNFIGDYPYTEDGGDEDDGYYSLSGLEVIKTYADRITDCLKNREVMGFSEDQQNDLRLALMNYLVYDLSMHLTYEQREHPTYLIQDEE